MSAAPRAARRAVGLSAQLGRPQPGRRLLPTQMQAIALLVPMRPISTDRHTSTGSSAPPPPGFNVKEAQKPLTQDGSKPAASAKGAGQKDASAANSADGASSEPKTLSELAVKKEAEAKDKVEKQGKKLSLGQRIKHEVQHYWDGTKLLATEVKISTRLALKMAAGYELTRRENRQLQRTVQDLGRLVPFSVFIIVPFAEALLPIALRLFPNLLPSTYESQSTKDKKSEVLRNSRKEVSSFLRTTLKETGLPLTPATAAKEEFATFFRKLRAADNKPTADDVIKVCHVFRDDLTLDNLSRPQLVSMCQYLNLNKFGTDMMLRYQIRHRMRQIKRDDKAISYEGVDSLNTAELQMACASRGIKTHGVSPARLREDLQSWLDLRLTHGVPSTLLVLSNAYMYGQSNATSGFESYIGALTDVLSTIPEELFHEIELEVHNAEGAATNRQRLEVLKEQEELIDEENEQNQENEDTGMATPRDTEDIDEKTESVMKAQASEAADAQADKEAVDIKEKSQKSDN